MKETHVYPAIEYIEVNERRCCKTILCFFNKDQIPAIQMLQNAKKLFYFLILSRTK